MKNNIGRMVQIREDAIERLIDYGILNETASEMLGKIYEVKDEILNCYLLDNGFSVPKNVTHEPSVDLEIMKDFLSLM